MSPLLVEVADGVAVLTLNRPDRRNAYTAEMGELLSAAYRDCDGDDAVRAIVLTGAGPAFCAGADFAGDPFAAPGAARAERAITSANVAAVKTRAFDLLAAN